MALSPDMPKSPYEILEPGVRWFPADKYFRSAAMDKVIPPLVASLRKNVKEFRDSDYGQASVTSRSLLKWWFTQKHLMPGPGGNLQEFQYFFAQREALETIVFLYDVVKVKTKFDLMRFDNSNIVREDMFDESWLRAVIKMATGTGKTKVMALALAWSYFHKIYEPDSTLARNFLVIAPNIIVLDRIYKDFEGLKIFYSDPIIPSNGFAGRDWQNDFQMVLHKQDEVRATQPVGNIFLSNIQRVYSGRDEKPSPDDENTMDYFLGKKGVSETTGSNVDLGVIVRDVDELMIINDEAHHVHDPKLAWFKSIQDIHNHMLHKGSSLSLQLDVTATPKHTNGAIFVQTISDYSLVEAIRQNVVKHPVLPDAPSRDKLHERPSLKYVEKYKDYIDLGVLEWRKVYEEHLKLGKKAILFVMTDDTRNCDEVAEYLEGLPGFEGAVLTIHTKNNGEISEGSTGKAKEELENLRRKANEIDADQSPYKAIVSVLMLKEGWDVRNVTTIVGLRAYSSKSNILPEQTLGRGLRKMYYGLAEEYVSVIGTKPFMEFIESIKSEGVELTRKPMGEGTEAKVPLMVEVDRANPTKNLDKLDIEIPILSPRIMREYKNFSELDITLPINEKITPNEYSQEELKAIVFKELTTNEVTHVTYLDSAGVADYRNVIGWFTRQIMKRHRLFSGYDVLYEKVQSFISDELFTQTVNLEEPQVIRNLSEPSIIDKINIFFSKKINFLIIIDKGAAEVRDYIKLSNTRSIIANEQEFLLPKKSVFNRIIGDSHFELEFASFLEQCPDVISYAKNILAIGYKIEYTNSNDELANYYPDFIVKVSDRKTYIVETKGLEDLDDPLKLKRLKLWCEDVNNAQNKYDFDFLFVNQKTYNIFSGTSFNDLLPIFTKYKQ